MKSENLIGVFDSGVGGLSVLKKLIPYGGNYIYFGDTKNLPYGNKTKEQIINFTRDIIKFFIKKGAKKVIMACNTSSALAYETLHKEFGSEIEICPLIQTASPYIAEKGNIIGIMATEGTIKSGAYKREIQKYNKDADVYELACPKFVPIVENRLYDDKESIDYIKEHLQILLDKKCEKIVLGCTHYPYLVSILKNWAAPSIFIDPADYMVKIVENNPKNTPLNIEFYVSSEPERFRESAKVFMNVDKEIKLIEFDSLE